MLHIFFPINKHCSKPSPNSQLFLTQKMDFTSNKPEKHHRNNIRILIFTALTSLLVTALVLALVQSQNTITNNGLTTSNDALTATLSQTIEAVEHNHFTIRKLKTSKKGLTEREQTALRICSELIELTLEYLHLSKTELKKENYSSSGNLNAYLSAAQTNQDTCIDEFTLGNDQEQLANHPVITAHKHVFRLISNMLATIKNLSNSEKSKTLPDVSTTLPWSVVSEWPEWLSASDRRLLQASTVTPNVTVAADGTGDFTTVSAAVAAAPNRSTSRYVIRIRAGVYRENVEVASNKPNLMFVGDGMRNTIITANRSVALTPGIGTYNSSTVAVVGAGFLARDMTFMNSAGPDGHQAVALRVNSDLSAFYRCGMLAYQDTLYVHSLRQFYTGCFVVGTVDFIFGNAAVVFQNCDISPRRPNPNQRNMVTAQGRSDPNQNTGIVIQRCRITAQSDLLPVQSQFPSYLGRPWREYSRTVVMQSQITDVINPAGWYPWNGDFALATLFYAEYSNTGAGADTSQRVNWTGYRVLTSDAEAMPFTAAEFIGAANWLPATQFPYMLGL